MEFIANYGLFLAKMVTSIIATLVLILGIVAIISKRPIRLRENLEITNINDKFNDYRDLLESEILNKTALKKLLKDRKTSDKKDKKTPHKNNKKTVFVIEFDGDLYATHVRALREEIAAILTIAQPKDEVVVCLESPGGTVPSYGLAASQLQRLRDHNIQLTVIVDKVAASGGYLMAVVAQQILAAPFAVIGSVGVVGQLPNFNRLLKKHDIDYELITAGEYKRTLTVFGENTEPARKKFKEDLEQVHLLFKNFIRDRREKIDIDTISTGEYWYGTDALKRGLIDGISTSDEYLQRLSATADIYQVTFRIKPGLMEKITSSINIRQLLAKFANQTSI
jgi:serine protease SohB